MGQLVSVLAQQPVKDISQSVTLAAMKEKETTDQKDGVCSRLQPSELPFLLWPLLLPQLLPWPSLTGRRRLLLTLSHFVQWAQFAFGLA